jgi:saccharopine dehydrogenase-like NADP-dependent oxidoreductase
MSRKQRREKNLTNIEDLEQRMEGLEKLIDDVLGIRNEEVNNIHYLVGMTKHYQMEFANTRNTIMIFNKFLEEKKLKEDFEKWAKDKEEEEKKKTEVKIPENKPVEAKPNGDIEHVHTN